MDGENQEMKDINPSIKSFKMKK